MDTTWGSLFIRALDSNPSTGTVIIFIGLAITAAFVYVVLNLSKNTELTKAIISPHAEMSKTIMDIRADQLVSNAERKEHGKRLDLVEEKIEDLQTDFHSFRCGIADVCPNRKASNV